MSSKEFQTEKTSPQQAEIKFLKLQNIEEVLKSPREKSQYS